jgi:hypothetical protein
MLRMRAELTEEEEAMQRDIPTMDIKIRERMRVGERLGSRKQMTEVGMATRRGRIQASSAVGLEADTTSEA